MADVHPIRLRGPWQYSVLWKCAESFGSEPDRDAAQLPPPGKVQMPVDWGTHLGRDFRGCVRYVRNFGCPTALEPHEMVHLVVEGVDAFARIGLNGTTLGEATLAGGPVKFDVTARLRERNELTVEVELPRYDSLTVEAEARPARLNEPGGLFGEVRLEISQQFSSTP